MSYHIRLQKLKDMKDKPKEEPREEKVKVSSNRIKELEDLIDNIDLSKYRRPVKNDKS